MFFYKVDNMKTNGEIKTCKSELCCKATAALKKQVSEELENEDVPLQELLDAQATTTGDSDEESKTDKDS